jgi:hypothetical protein
VGAKYLPTHKDLKATRRFQEKQARVARDKQRAAAPAAKPAKQN